MLAFPVPRHLDFLTSEDEDKQGAREMATVSTLAHCPFCANKQLLSRKVLLFFLKLWKVLLVSMYSSN